MTHHPTTHARREPPAPASAPPPVSAEPRSLSRLLHPASVAVIGATRESTWAQLAMSNLRSATAEQGPELHVVARDPAKWQDVQAPLHVVEKVADLPLGVDAALVLRGARHLESTVAECAERGVGALSLLASGFAEDGEQGRARQAALAAQAAEAGVRILGPNSMGFLSAAAGVNALVSSFADRPLPGTVGVISQSGSVARSLVGILTALRAGLSYAFSTGNEADIDVAELMDALVEDEGTRVICLYVESVRRHDAFAAAATRAARAGIPVIMLRVGKSEVSKRLSLAHTGAVASDNDLLTGLLRQHAVLEVDSLEELASTAAYLATPGATGAGAPFFVAGSGGRCNLIADACNRLGLELAAVPRRLEENGITNPHDATGAFVTDVDVLPRLLREVAAEVRAEHVVLAVDFPTDEHSAAAPLMEGFRAALDLGPSLGTRVSFMSATAQPLNRFQQECADQLGISFVLPGTEGGVRALAHGSRWRELACRVRGGTAEPAVHRPSGSGEAVRGELSEFRARTIVGTNGMVPFVPAQLATTPAEAERAAATIGGDVVLKVSSARIPHKRDAGVMELGVPLAEVAEVSERLLATAAEIAGAEVDGVLVSPLRAPGLELFVAALRHDDFGDCLALQLGGSRVEEVQLPPIWRRLPLDVDGIRWMMEDLADRAHVRALEGAPWLSRDHVVTAVAAIAERSAELLEAGCLLVELNPMVVRAEDAEVLDVWIEARS